MTLMKFISSVIGFIFLLEKFRNQYTIAKMKPVEISTFTVY